MVVYDKGFTTVDQLPADDVRLPCYLRRFGFDKITIRHGCDIARLGNRRGG